MASIRQRLAKHGFNLTGTGGNCTAYVRTDGEVEEVLTSAEYEGNAPRKESEPVMLMTGTDLEQLEGEGVPTEGYTLAQVLASLEHTSEEYHLLNLRLENFVVRPVDA